MNKYVLNYTQISIGEGEAAQEDRKLIPFEAFRIRPGD